MTDGNVRLRRIPTVGLTGSEIEAIRSLLWTAFGPGEEGFTEDDWDHSIGGIHFVLELEGDPVAHASVVRRELHLGDRSMHTGYVEAVATDPRRHGRGFGSIVMGDVNSYIEDGFQLGALGTGRIAFYERLGWQRWLGPSFVRTDGGPVRTVEDDGYILVLETPTSGKIDLTAPISCDWRPGDVW